MVIMNSADENAKINNPVKTNGIIDDPKPCCSNATNHKNNEPQNKFKESLVPISDCNNHHITNGAYVKAVSSSYKAVNIYGNGGSSDLVRPTTTQFENGNPVQRQISPDNNKKDLKNNIECQQGSISFSGVVPKLPNYRNKDASLDYDRNSSSEDEECCIYTYKGDSNQMADLPSSFFRLDFMPLKTNGNSRNSSPDMDYLEMDFDPGPSNDRDSFSGSECDEERFVTEEPLSLPEDCELVGLEPEPTPPSPLSTPSPVRPEQPGSSAASIVRSPSCSPPRDTPVPVNGNSNLQHPFCYCISNKLSPTSIDENFNDGGGGTMVWKEQEAKEKQVSQIATGACGATAVINVLLGLSVPFSVSSVRQHVATRTRREGAPISDYLQSRCHSGATHVDMIRGLHNASNDLVYARFFHMYPRRSISLASWLSHWIRKGAVPIVIRNLQCGVQPGTELPDMWHHQMVYGVSAQGIHLTNPLEIQSEALLRTQLTSPSVLKVRREDVLSRWTPDTSLHDLAHPSLPLWRKLNVLGQVVNVIRENNISQHHKNKHITIPASYCSGVILAVLRNSPAYDELRFTPELPVDPFSFS